MLTIATWIWGDKYGTEDVAKLFAGCRRHMKQPFRFLVITDDFAKAPPGTEPWAIRDPELCKVKGCFARLRMFDPDWLAWLAVDRLLCLDLDLIVTGPLDALVDVPENFRILHGANAANPCKFNGSVMYLRVNCAPQVWSEFSLEKAAKVPFYELPDDQGWIWAKLPNAAGWKCGSESGIYAYKKPGWLAGDDLPADARIVAFPGSRDPKQVAHLGWVKEHWRE